MVTIIGNSDVVGHHWCFSDNNSAKSCHKPWIRNFAWLMMSGVIHEFYMVRNWAFFWLKSHWENTKVMFVSKTIFLFKWTFLQYFGKIKWFDIWVSEGISRLLSQMSFLKTWEIHPRKCRMLHVTCRRVALFRMCWLNSLAKRRNSRWTFAFFRFGGGEFEYFAIIIVFGSLAKVTLAVCIKHGLY